MEDPALLHLCSLGEYSSIQELPCLGTLQLRLISEGFFTCIASPDRWRKTGGIYHPNQFKEEWRNHQYGNPHHWWGKRERDLGMVMVFCHPNQARIETCDALSTLHQNNLSELSVVVVRIYSNTSYIPRGTSHSLYLDVDTLSGGTGSAQFPLDRLHLHQLLPFSKSEVLVPHEVGEEGLETYPHLPEFLWDSSDEEHCISNMIPMSTPLLSLEDCTQTKGGLDSHPASNQTEGGLGCHPAST